MPPSRREDLVDAAMRVFYRHGFHASGLDRILEEGGISRMTLYNHFKSKDELIVAALRRRDEIFRNRMMKFVESRAKAPLDRLLATPVLWLVQVAAAATLAASLAANWWLLKRRGKGWLTRRAAGPGDRDWLAGYAVVALGAAFVVYGLAPTTIMWWQGIPLFHAAVIPPVLWASHLLDGPRRRWALRGVIAVAVMSTLIAGSMALGAPIYRCGGRQQERFPLRSDSPMFDDLGIRRTCPWEMNVAGAWWPDVLPEEGAPRTPSPLAGSAAQ